MLKETRERYQLNIKIMVDLHGIKNSVGKLSKPLKVILGNTLYLDTTTSIGFNNTIPFKNYDLLDRLVEGDMLFLTQGHVKMRVVDTLGNGCL